MNRCVIHRHDAVSIYATAMSAQQTFLTAVLTDEGADAAQAAQNSYAGIAETLANEGKAVVHERVFGTCDVRDEVLLVRRTLLSRHGIDPHSPVTYVEGAPPSGSGLAGIQLHAVAGETPEDVWNIADEEGNPVGRGWTLGGTRFITLHSVHGLSGHDGPAPSRREQAERMFDQAAALLKGQGAEYRDVARTWIYNPEILEWYGPFNEVRNARYGEFGLMPDENGSACAKPLALPASTGIQAGNPFGAACLMDVFAVSGDPEVRPEVVQMTNRRQKDAFRYGSAFSRAAAIRGSDATRIEISGTAAIDEEGTSLYHGDARKQVLRTLENVEVLIAQEGASLLDICGATIFVKCPGDVEICRNTLAERGLGEFPGVWVLADVCRDDLLFEIDGMASVPRS